MYESSAKPSGEKVTLPEYIGRMADGQKDIYYLAAPSRELAETSPYFEALKVGHSNLCSHLVFLEIIFIFMIY